MKKLFFKLIRLAKNAIQKLIGTERCLYFYHKRRIPDKDIRDLVMKGYTRSKELRDKDIPIEDYPVDFLVYWVDPNDPEWQKEKNKYHISLNEVQAGYNSPARYRDWDMFEYWFRSVEKYAPWVNRVFLVTWGHVPKWLNLNHPKLTIVNHLDYIPEEYLPTFSANPIELNFWRIPELSEHFVLFNDDMYLVNPVKKEDFFCRGLPKLCSVTKPYTPVTQMKAFDYMLYNSLGAYNEAFDIRHAIEEHPEKWFSYVYEDEMDYNIRTYQDGYLTGIFFSHVCTPMRKSSMKECYDYFSYLIDGTCRNRFRTHTDFNRQIFHLWEIIHNTYEPVRSGHFGSFINVNLQKLDWITRILNSSSVICLCANDHDEIPQMDYDLLRQSIIDLFEKKYPEKSSFER